MGEEGTDLIMRTQGWKFSPKSSVSVNCVTSLTIPLNVHIFCNIVSVPVKRFFVTIVSVTVNPSHFVVSIPVKHSYFL